jgi:hypothetical protein
MVIRLGLHLGFGLHRWSFHLSGLYEAARLVAASLTGTACFVATFYFLQTPGPPRSVLAIEFFLTTSLIGAFRASPPASPRPGSWPRRDRAPAPGSGP